MLPNHHQLQYVYFEHQTALSNQCGKCSINNLLGCHFYSKESLNQICYSLSDDIINPHKHIFGGDYDGNVLIIALQNFGCECKWLDSREMNKICIQSTRKNERRKGYIVNRKGKKNGLMDLIGLSGRHWVAVRYLNNQYYLLDSKSEKQQPQIILSIDNFLREQMQNEACVMEVLQEQEER